MQGYRRLLRSARHVFRGDVYAMDQARKQLREEFLRHKDVTNETELAELQKGIEEADEMLRFSIVQGRLNDRGNYEVSCEISRPPLIGFS